MTAAPAVVRRGTVARPQPDASPGLEAGRQRWWQRTRVCPARHPGVGAMRMAREGTAAARARGRHPTPTPPESPTRLKDIEQARLEVHGQGGVRGVPARPVHRPRGRADLLLRAVGLPRDPRPGLAARPVRAGQSRRPTRCSTSLRQLGAGRRRRPARRARSTRWSTPQGAGSALVLGLAGALWSASGYVGAFGRAMNRVYQVDEGRPVWKLRPVVLLITRRAWSSWPRWCCSAWSSAARSRRRIGDAVGLGDQATTVWNIAKWPVMLGIVVVMVAVLYYATPNVQQPKFRWVSVGAAVAIVVWVRRVGRLRLLRRATSARTTRPTAPSPASSSSCCGCGSPTSRCCSGPRSTPSWSGRASCRPASQAEQTAPAAAARHPQLRQGRGRSSRSGSPRAAGCDSGRPPRGDWRDAGNGYVGERGDATRAGARTIGIRAGAAPFGAGPRRGRAPILRPAHSGARKIAGQRRPSTRSDGTYASAVTPRDAR